MAYYIKGLHNVQRWFWLDAKISQRMFWVLTKFYSKENVWFCWPQLAEDQNSLCTINIYNTCKFSRKPPQKVYVWYKLINTVNVSINNAEHQNKIKVLSIFMILKK